MVDYRIPGYGEQFEWDYPPEDVEPYMDIPVPQDLYTTQNPDPLAAPPVTLGGPAGGPTTRAAVGQEASGLFSGPNSFARSMYETAKALPGTVARAVDFPAASLRGEVDPLSDEGIGRAMDAAGTVTLGGGAIPRAAPRNSLRAGYARPMNPDVEHITSAAIYGPDGNIYAGRMHYEIGETLPPDVRNKFWDDYRPEREGFVTSTGRFVTREEADEIARASGQIDDTLTGQRSLSSEDMMAHSWGGEDDDMLSANRSKGAGFAPLAMDREARMARAAEIGFNTDAYHGSTSDIREFYPDSHFGTKTAAQDRLIDENVIERGGQRIGIPDEEIPYLDRYNNPALGVGESVYPVKLRGDYAEWPGDMGDWWGVLKLKTAGSGIEDWVKDKTLGEYDPELSVQKNLENSGFSGIQYENGYEDPGSTSFMAFDPKDIRSTAAAFDPAKSDSADILAANRSATAGAVPLFSAMERKAAALPQPKAPGAQWESTLRNKGVPGEELDWTGVADWLKERGTLPVTKEELLSQINQRQTQVGVKTYGRQNTDNLSIREYRGSWEIVDENGEFQGGPYPSEEIAQRNLSRFGSDLAAPTKFSNYQLPGGENYREVLLTLPTEKGGAPNVVKNREGWRLEWPNGEPVMSSSTNTQVRYFDEADARQAARSYGRHDQGGFVSSHWDEPNVLAHMRVNDRYIPREPDPAAITAVEKAKREGPQSLTPEERQLVLDPRSTNDRVLFAEEIQSDWHQKGRREGYQLSEAQEDRLRAEQKAYWDKMYDEGRITEDPDTGEFVFPDEVLAKLEEYNTLIGASDKGVPNAPFKKSWPDLTLKRLVADAVEGGYDAIAWTDGATQADRYNLAKHVSSITYDSQTGTLTGSPVDGGADFTIGQGIKPDKLPDYIGKEPADRLLNNPSRKLVIDDDYPENYMSIISGSDLTVGGEGMKAFYDVELPRRAKKLFGKYGAVVEDINLGPTNYDPLVGEEHALPESAANPKIHILRITPEMRTALQTEGLPLYANRSKAAGAAAMEEEPQYRTGGRFASGGGVKVEVNGRTYQGEKANWRGRPLSKNIEDRRGSQVNDVNRRKKTDRLPSALESLISPESIGMTAPDPNSDELMSPIPLGDGPPQTIEEMILRQGGDQFTSGLVEDPTPGRTDRLPTSMPADSYVIPADIVSGMGQGNTLAGARILDAIFSGHSAPVIGKAAGGAAVADRRIPVIVAGGEYVVPPDRVRSIGAGDPAKGHKNLDLFVKKHRVQLVRRLKSLDGPRTD